MAINYGKIYMQANELMIALKTQANEYVNYRYSLYLYNKYKERYPEITKPIRPITIVSIRKNQVVINKLRKKVGLKSYNAIDKINLRIKAFQK